MMALTNSFDNLFRVWQKQTKLSDVLTPRLFMDWRLIIIIIIIIIPEPCREARAVDHAVWWEDCPGDPECWQCDPGWGMPCCWCWRWCCDWGPASWGLWGVETRDYHWESWDHQSLLSDSLIWRRWTNEDKYSQCSWYGDKPVNWFPLRIISSSLSVAWNNWINKSY